MREVGHGKGLVSWWWGLFRTSQGCEARFAHRRHMTPAMSRWSRRVERDTCPLSHATHQWTLCSAQGSLGSLNCL